MISNYQDY